MSIKPFDFSDNIFKEEGIKNINKCGSVQVKFLINLMYKTGSSCKIYNDLFYTDKIFKKLNKEGQIVETIETVSVNKDSSFSSRFNSEEKSYLFFYKDNFIRVDLNDEVSFDTKQKDKCKLEFFYPVNRECADKDFVDHIVSDNLPGVYILNHEYGEYVFTRFNVTLPKNIDLDLNYGEGFSKTNKLLVESINKNYSGLYMFHGPPGTGKSTYIKYLSTVVKKDVIFFPTSMVHNLTDPNIINLLIKKQNCILVLEDAEKAIMKRESSNDASLVSTLLNMTDGILGDVLKLNIIVTYNCDRADIDNALLRRGRLKAEHSFKPLSKAQGKALVDKLGIDLKIDEDITLADIYNFKSDTDLIKDVGAINEKKVIGFGA